MNNTGIVILAAGRSSRFGSIKQLLPFNHKTLLQHTIDEAVASGAAPIIVVTGAHAKEVSASISDHKVEIVFNEHWEQGKGSGIVAGVQKIITLNIDIQKIILAVCDQPFVMASLFIQLCQTQKESAMNMVASAYADTIGTPVLFTRKYFDHLLGLKNEEGAKKILMTYGEDVATVDFPQGNIDIDTKADYKTFLSSLS
ncbi:MAG: nucleotidyltransferase family protein [Phycisphaerae bacterium]|nr:nucleotidyltransferase family protein [Saprospiraceae bacterium]